jgi:hypothetical protein
VNEDPAIAKIPFSVAEAPATGALASIFFLGRNHLSAATT